MADGQPAASAMREGTVETDVAALIETPRYEPAIQWTGFEHPYPGDGRVVATVRSPLHAPGRIVRGRWARGTTWSATHGSGR